MPENKEILVVPKTESMVDMTQINTRVPEEIKTWLEKVEESPAARIVTDSTGQPVLQPTAPAQARMSLPTTKTKFMLGFKKTVNDAGRWLSVFVLRLIKIKKGQANFLEE